MMTSTTNRPSRRARPHRCNHFKCQPRLERLEHRLALSGFGPEAGASIVEPCIGGFTDIERQVFGFGAVQLLDGTRG